MRIWPTKRGWKRLGIALALLVGVGLLVNGIFAWRAELQLRSRLAAIRAAGDAASIAELAPEPIPDEENAAAILAAVNLRLKEFSKEHSQFFNTPIGKAYGKAQDRHEPATQEQIAAIRTILDKYLDLEQAIANAARCERFASKLDFSLNHADFLQHLLETVQDGRTAARFLGWRGEVLLSESKYDEAVKNGIQALRLARLHEEEPTMVAQLVAMAMRASATRQLYDALALKGAAPELHATVDEELAKLDNSQHVVEALKAERAVSADWINGTFGDLNGIKAILAHMFGWIMKSYQVGVLDAMEEVIQKASRPMHDVRSELRFSGSARPKTGHGALADLLVPALEAFFEAHVRNLAVARALRIHNALRQFAEQNGREAMGLEDLGLPKEATIDPYSGQPLKLKHTDDGWVIYSVMENGVDDGGDFKAHKDYGVAPPKWRGTE